MNRTRHISLVVTCFITIVFIMSGIVLAADKVVVIPLLGDEATGNATTSDVLQGKTFSNSSGTGLKGTRPPAPVGTDGIDLEYTVQPPDPRFSNIGTTYLLGSGVKDHMTGLSWQRSLSAIPYTRSGANAYCESLVTGLPPPDVWELAVTNDH